jgi:2-methylcitrate dehydratase PrpD
MTETTSRARPPYLQRLAEFSATTTLADLSVAARDRARSILADCIPVIAAGMQQPEMQKFVQAQLAQAARGTAWVIGTKKRAASLDAALLNGTAGTWLELDEGNLFAKGHPGIQVVPAAVALAQELGSNGADLLAAVALGYEVSARISRAANVRLTIHPHGTYGVIGAAVAAARLKRFDTQQMLELLNVAATMGMATSRQSLLDGATVRNIFTGPSGYMGLTAARLVECGFTGEIDGVGSVYGKVLSDTFDRDKVVEGLGTEWLIAKSYFKLHPLGRYAHAAVDALDDLLSRVPRKKLDPAAIERIEVRAYMLAASLSGKNIVSSFGARFSIPFALASIIYHGRSGLVPFEDAAVANPDVQALVQKVDLQEDPALTARYPDESPCDLKIVMRDGKVHTGQCVVMKGEPSNPHSPEDLKKKFFDLGKPVWGKAKTQRLFDGLMGVENIPDFGVFAKDFKL